MNSDNPTPANVTDTINPSRHSVKQRSNLIGRIVWGMIASEIDVIGRSIYLLSGLSPEHLIGISRTYPRDFKSRIRLAINPTINQKLLDSLPKEHTTDKPPVRLRNDNSAGVIVMAVPDIDHDEGRASLGEVLQIDRTVIQAQTELWFREITSNFETDHLGEDTVKWLKCLIKGLDQSGVTKELDQFAEFVQGFVNQEGDPLEMRLRSLGPVIKLPRNCFLGIPSKRDAASLTASDFSRMFQSAERELSGIPYLTGPDDKRLDYEKISKRVAELRKFVGQSGDHPTTELLDAVGKLIIDHRKLKLGDWRESQIKFCENLDWIQHGEKIFGTRRSRTAKSLAEKTHEYFNEDHVSVSSIQEVKDFFRDFNENNTSKEQEEAFFTKYEDKIRDRKLLHEEWRRHFFIDVVKDEPDLLAAILKGVHTVLAKNLSADERLPADVRIILTAKDCEKASSWDSLDNRTYALFRQEARLLSGALSECIEFRFGKWLDDVVIERAEPQDGKDARMIELEMSLESADPNETKRYQRIRIFWRPSQSGKNSIALSWVDDIRALVQGKRNEAIRVPSGVITSRIRGKGALVPILLSDTATFTDVCGEEYGRTTEPAGTAIEDDCFHTLLKLLDEYTSDNVISSTDHGEIAQAIFTFQTKFTAAIVSLHETPETIYTSHQITEQANSFGHLCSLVRLKLAGKDAARRNFLGLVCGIGITRLNTTPKAAIICAWHPLRLLERQAKAIMMAEFIGTLRENPNISLDGLGRACHKYHKILATWSFPEIAVVDMETHTAVEHCGGYSLTVSVEEPSVNKQALEAGAPLAAKKFMNVVEEYLKLNPHEESNLSIAIYNADTAKLPVQIAHDLEEKMADLKHLRCSLFITHDQVERVREAYATQSALLRRQDLRDTTGSFLSRLRVGVKSSDEATSTTGRPSIDVAYMYEAFFRYSQVSWNFVEGTSDALPDNVNLHNNLLPRHQSGDESGSLMAKIMLSPIKLPRAVAQFIDLCHATYVDWRPIESEHRAVPMRRVSWDNSEVRNTIMRAHELAEWVVSFDHMSSREMLASNGIEVIRDIVVPGTEAHLLVSSREPSRNLTQRIREDFASMSVRSLAAQADEVARNTISTVVNVAGQKVMSAARSVHAAREIIGLAAATNLVEWIETRKLIWFSLDDIQATLGLKGKIADTLSMGVRKCGENDFWVDMTVVEAKCVAKQSEVEKAKSSREQAMATLRTLQTNFVDQEDPVAQRAWGVDLLQLLSMRPGFSEMLSSRKDFLAFKDALIGGRVQFTVRARSVIVLHDDEEVENKLLPGVDPEDKNFIQYKIDQHTLSELLTRSESSDFLLSLKTKDPLALNSELTEPQPRSVDSKESVTSDEPLTEQDDEGQTWSPVNSESGKDEHTDPAETDVPLSSSTDHDEERTKTDNPMNIGNPSFAPSFHKALSRIADAQGSHTEHKEDMHLAEKISRQLQTALVEFNMQAKFTEDHITSTPNWIIVRFRGHNTLTIRKVEAKKSELRTTHALDVVNVREGLGEIGIYLARQNRRIVRLSDVWLRANWPSGIPELTTSFLIGEREDNSKPLWLNLTSHFGGNSDHAPHTLIAGETGSGKGVLIQNLLLQMVAFNSPENLELYVIDPKLGGDFFWISEAPHLQGGISTTQEQARTVIESLVAEMDSRYAKITSQQTSDIGEFNRKVAPPDRLPRIVVIHDEMADWMIGSEDYRKLIQGAMARLTAKARACGINIFLITQRASQNAIPVEIRNNLGNRLCLKVAERAGSELALTASGGENLLGKGHLAAKLSGDKPTEGEYFMAQVPFASTSELKELGQAAIRNWKK